MAISPSFAGSRPNPLVSEPGPHSNPPPSRDLASCFAQQQIDQARWRATIKDTARPDVAALFWRQAPLSQLLDNQVGISLRKIRELPNSTQSPQPQTMSDFSALYTDLYKSLKNSLFTAYTPDLRRTALLEHSIDFPYADVVIFQLRVTLAAMNGCSRLLNYFPTSLGEHHQQALIPLFYRLSTLLLDYPDCCPLFPVKQENPENPIPPEPSDTLFALIEAIQATFDVPALAAPIEKDSSSEEDAPNEKTQNPLFSEPPSLEKQDLLLSPSQERSSSFEPSPLFSPPFSEGSPGLSSGLSSSLTLPFSSSFDPSPLSSSYSSSSPDPRCASFASRPSPSPDLDRDPLSSSTSTLSPLQHSAKALPSAFCHSLARELPLTGAPSHQKTVSPQKAMLQNLLKDPEVTPAQIIAFHTLCAIFKELAAGITRLSIQQLFNNSLKSQLKLDRLAKPNPASTLRSKEPTPPKKEPALYRPRRSQQSIPPKEDTSPQNDPSKSPQNNGFSALPKQKEGAFKSSGKKSTTLPPPDDSD